MKPFRYAGIALLTLLAASGTPQSARGQQAATPDIAALSALNDAYFKRAQQLNELRKTRQIPASELPAMMKDPDTVVLDVRSREFYECSHIKGAKNLSLSDLTEKTLPQVAPSKQTRIIIYCAYSLAPVRQIAATAMAFPLIYQAGYENVYELQPVWEKNISIDPKKILPFDETGNCAKSSLNVSQPK